MHERIAITTLLILVPVLGSDRAVARSDGKVLRELSGRPAGSPDQVDGADSSGLSGGSRAVRKRTERGYQRRRLKNGTIRFYAPGWIADVRPDGSLRFHARRASWRSTQTALAYDIGDAVMRGRKMDPYAVARLRFMRVTAPWRAQLRRNYRLRVERRFFAELPGRLRSLWQRSGLSPAQKRARLYALWEECLEPGVARNRQLAQQARWMIQRFIQAHLPPSSPHRFTPAEIKRWNKQRKTMILFDPYGRQPRPLLKRAVPVLPPAKPGLRPAAPTPTQPAPPPSRRGAEPSAPAPRPGS